MNSQGPEFQISNFRYSKAKVLGKGSTGTVYLGNDVRTGNRVAIKVIDMQTIDNEVTTYLLNNQKKALSLLNHPNIVSTYEIIQNNENCYIVGEYCQGGTLYDYIKVKGRLAEIQAVQIIKGLVSGYSACVELGITHRDLKPANVLFKQGMPKIIDFGYAEIKGVQKPNIYYNVGSPSYMAPESILDNVYSEKSDIWSLGITLYEMLTGEVPLDTKDVVKTFNELAKSGVKFPGHVRIFCREIINRCLVPNVEKRISLQQLSNLLNCGVERTESSVLDSKRPTSAISNRILQSVEKSHLNSQLSPSKNSIVLKKPQPLAFNQQSVHHMPPKHSAKNSKQPQPNSQYFIQQPTKKVIPNKSPIPPPFQQNNINKKNPVHIQIKSPVISSSKHQIDHLNRNIHENRVLTRPVSMNGNLMSSLPNKHFELISSRTSNGSANSIKSGLNGNKIPNRMQSQNKMRVQSPAARIGSNKIMTNSMDKKPSHDGLRATVSQQINPHKSTGSFFLYYYGSP